MGLIACSPDATAPAFADDEETSVEALTYGAHCKQAGGTLHCIPPIVGDWRYSAHYPPFTGYPTYATEAEAGNASLAYYRGVSYTCEAVAEPRGEWTGGVTSGGRLWWGYWLGYKPTCSAYLACGKPDCGWIWVNRSRTLTCPPGYQLYGSANDLASYYCGTGTPTEPDECPAPGSNPVLANTGNKLQSEVDVEPTSTGLGLVRTYNSRAVPSSAMRLSGFGVAWRHTYEREIQVYKGPSATFATLVRADGRAVMFQRVSQGWSPPSGLSDRLVSTEDASGVFTSFTYTSPANEMERYSGSGRLLEIRRNGMRLTMSYAADGRLSSVRDPFGRTIRFVYSGQSISSVIDPAGRTVAYAYDSQSTDATLRRLVSVTYPGQETRRYLYAGMQGEVTSGSRLLLTGIVDERGVRIATYTYDSSSRVTAEERAGGVNRLTFTYGAGSTSMTDALGTAQTFTFGKIAGRSRPTSTSCSSCGGGAGTMTYDASGFLTGRTDPRGTRTRYVFDPARGLPLSWTEAEGLPEERTTSAAWHPSMPLPTRIIESGAGGPRTTTRVYGAHGLPTQVTTAAGGVTQTWTMTYDANGLMTAEDGPRSGTTDTTRWAYDSLGNLTSRTNALGHVTSLSQHDAYGRPLRIVDPNSLVTTLSYDQRGRILTRQVGTELTRYAYDKAGGLQRIDLPTGQWLSFARDTAHRITEVRDNSGNRLALTLDLLGSTIRSDRYDPSGVLRATMRAVFDSHRRLREVIQASGTTRFEYDANGNMTRVTNPLSQSSANGYDALDRIVSSVDPTSSRTETTYYADSTKSRVLDPRNLSTEFVRDAMSRLTRLTSPDTGVSTQTSFDESGNVLRAIDARGKTTDYRYDVLDRVMSMTNGGGTTTFAYDTATNGKGRLASAAAPVGATRFAYDVQGRVTSRTQTLTPWSRSFVTLASYDSAGRLTRTTTPSGRAIAYSYTAEKLTGVTIDGAPVLSSITYTPWGEISGGRFASGIVHTRTYDTDMRLLTLSLANTTKTYRYDASSRITAITDSARPADNWSYGYDAADRLVREASTALTKSYTYDTNGNRLTTSGTGGSSAYIYPATSHRLSAVTGSGARSFTYDASGNVTGDGRCVYTHDDAGRLSSATCGTTTTTYRYDALGQRVAKTLATATGSVTTLFAWDADDRLVGEYDASGNPIREYVWVGSIPVASVHWTSSTVRTVYSVHADHLGTPRQLSDAARRVVWEWKSDAFGNGAPNQNPDGDGVSVVYPLRFPGQYFDAETGLHQNYFRDYDPRIGRYVQSDPIGLGGGLNTYAYADGDPLRRKDPLGLFSSLELCKNPRNFAACAEAGMLPPATRGPIPRPTSVPAPIPVPIPIPIPVPTPDCREPCPPCDPKIGTQCVELHVGHAHKGLNPHYHAWQMNQDRSCRCIWNKKRSEKDTYSIQPVGLAECSSYPSWLAQEGR